MPKAHAAYDPIILQEILLQDDCRTINDKGNVYSCGHEVYAIISKRMIDKGSHITARHVHTILNNDRRGFRTMVRKQYGINMISNDSKSHNDSDYHSTQNATCNTSESRRSKSIRLVLSASDWLQMTPRQLISGQRTYWKFKQGWADVIVDKIIQQHGGVSCVFSFKNNIVNPTATARLYASFSGSCVECKASIKGELLNRPQKDVDVIIDCHIDNIVLESHVGKKKRQLRGGRREKVANLLIDQQKDAVTYRRDEAKRLKQFGQKEPATLPTCPVFRKAKEQQYLKLYGLVFSNPVLNLLHHAKFGKDAGSIRAVSALKFSCIYWTREQFQIYVARCKKDPNAILTIDATGGISKRDSKQDPYIFLYQCMLVTSEGSLPVLQMVSADQSALQIANFIRLFLSHGAPIPPIVVSDFGWALLIAASQTFCKCTDLQDYLQKCFNAVVNGEDSLPTSYLRLDVSHLIAMLSRWKSLKIDNSGCAARRFYLRCLSQAYKMSDFNDLSYSLESVLAVCLSEYVGFKEDGRVLPSETRLQYLNSVIKGVIFDDDLGFPNKDHDQPDDDFQMGHDESPISSSWTTWAGSIFDAAEKIASESTDGSVINACYNPKFAKQLKRQLLAYLPLWTGVMRPFFKIGSPIATSSSVEAEFNDLKNRAFKNKLPIRVDKFVLQHLDHLDAKIKLASNPSDLPSHLTSSCITRTPKVIDLSMDPIETTNITIDNQATNAGCQSQEASSADSFFLGNIKHSTPHSTPTIINDRPQEQSISNDIETVDSSFACELPCSPAIQKSVNFDQPDDAIKTIDTAFSNSDIPNLENTDQSDENNQLKDVNICEDWRGLGGKSKHIDSSDKDKVKDRKRAKPSYLDKCPEWDYVKDAKLGTIPMFRNGFLSGTVTIGSSKINLIKTCAFDSIVQIILHAISINKTYLRHVEPCTSPIIALALTMLNDRNLSAKHLKERAKILLDLNLFKNAVVVYTRHIKKLDATCNVAHLADDLFIHDPSFTKKVDCSCGLNVTRPTVMVNVNIDILMCKGLQFMQEAIDDAQVMQRTCYECKNGVEERRIYGPHIMIDLSVFSDHRYITHSKIIEPELDSLPPTITLDENVYVIAGVSHYVASSEHYVAYAKTGMYWTEYDDLHSKRSHASPRTHIKPHLIIYTAANS